ncbi:cytochrome P450 [Saccharothrix xinjiangensis]|uniref:Cytochrome P450 n=1 Tax=Saccharothrix xinjiangensis TaxID=204798 RepID=A0ABV9Y7S8_9PSEU
MSTIAPGPRGLPLLGNLPQWRAAPAEFLLGLRRDHGGVVRLRIGPYLMHLVTDPAAVHRVLVENNRNYVRGKLYEQFKLVMGEGLLTTDGPVWKSHRRVVQPAFHGGVVNAIVPSVVEATGEMLDRWEVKAREGEPVDLLDEMLRLTLVTLSRSLFGYDPAEAVPAMKRIGDACMELMFPHGLLSEHLPGWVPTARNQRVRRVDRFFTSLIDDIRANHARTGGGRLVELVERAGWTDREVRDELLTVYLAGHETTATSACWALWAIANHRHVEEELVAEVGRVLGDRVPVAGDLPGLEGTGHAIDEALRLYPPIWTFPRDAVDDDVVGGHDIPGGSSILLSPLVTHRDPDVWENPEAFDPRRFAGGAGRERAKLTYFPFGGGARLCVGKEMALLELRVIVAMVLRRFRVEAVPGRFLTYGQSMISLRPRQGVRVRLRLREPVGA